MMEMHLSISRIILSIFSLAATLSLPPPENFGNAIESLSAANGGKGVVILIDEYDAPVGHALGDIDMAEAIRDRMSSLYSRMKNRTGDIRFLLMTGVSKFTRLSVFSALSNLVDVTQDEAYATMFGYTEEELEANFEEHLRAHAEKMGKTYEDYRAEMRKWYNGFRFSTEVETTVYNPVSVALTLFKKERDFKATWATTGRPSMLMNYLKREEVAELDYENLPEVAEADLSRLAFGGCTETMLEGLSAVGSDDAGINTALIFAIVGHDKVVCRTVALVLELILKILAGAYGEVCCRFGCAESDEFGLARGLEGISHDVIPFF